MVKTSILVFDSRNELVDFLRRKLQPTKVGEIEFQSLENYPARRILFTAEHPKVNHFPELEAWVGEKDTDLLAKLAALHLRSAFLVSWIPRHEADAARDPAQLGKGLRLWLKTRNGKTIFVPIHRNPAYFGKLVFFHKKIQELKPRILVSIHGTHRSRKFDLLLGFGANYEGIGGKKAALEFKLKFLDYLDKVFSELGLREDFKVGVGKLRFAGGVNYVLDKHVVEFNKSSGEKRIGVQAEFNWKIRGEDLKYSQVVVQALGEFLLQNFNKPYKI